MTLDFKRLQLTHSGSLGGVWVRYEGDSKAIGHHSNECEHILHVHRPCVDVCSEQQMLKKRVCGRYHAP